MQIGQLTSEDLEWTKATGSTVPMCPLFRGLAVKLIIIIITTITVLNNIIIDAYS